MHTNYDSDNREMMLYITILCRGTKWFRVWAEDLGKQNSKYADRLIEVTNSRTIHFNFPVSPKQLFLGCVNARDIKDQDFEVIVKEEPLKKYDIYQDTDTKQFLQLAVNFSQTCGFDLPKNNRGTLYATPDSKFNIKYYPVIIDRPTGNAMSTPARIGHNTGQIEVSAVKFLRYTIPMRICILLHEYSHKYRNPKIGLKISNEFGADVNGLYLYLGNGWSKVDAICVFAKVFLKAQTDGNIQRMRKIQEYIRNFENQDYAQLL